MASLITRPFFSRAAWWSRPFAFFVFVSMALPTTGILGGAAHAQGVEPGAPVRPRQPAAPANPIKTADDQLDLAKPENFRLTTKDGVLLNCRYFPGAMGKKTVPVILLHGWEGNLRNYEGLAQSLQKEGFAVIVPDLRGHGESMRQRIPGREEGIELKRSKMRKDDFENMIRYDLEAVKKFLIEENNKGELNIESLVVVGAEMGALIAINWVAQDWNFPRLPNYKQGQDARAFILISPPQSFRGLTMREALRQPSVRADLSALILFGSRDPKAAASARRIFNPLKKYHQMKFSSRDEAIKKRDLFFLELDTSLQGTKLLDEKALGVDKVITAFLQRRLVNRSELFPWSKREKPFGN